MDGDVAFYVLNALALLPWSVLILAPRSSAAGRVSGRPGFVLVLCLAYVVLVLGSLLGDEAAGPLYTVQGLRWAMFSQWGFLAAWAHYLALDLFAGTWVHREALRHGYAPSGYLLFVMLAGPLGLGVFLLRRNASPKAGALHGEQAGSKR